MPCNCDGMEPGRLEVESKTVATHLLYLDDRMGVPSSPQVRHAATNFYGDRDRVHELTAELCENIRSLTEDQLNAFVYNGRDPRARALADWWDAHQEADREREANEEDERRKRALIASARKKLTEAELRALKG